MAACIAFVLQLRCSWLTRDHAACRMLAIPSFERCVLVADDPGLAARISALFTRRGRYFPV